MFGLSELAVVLVVIIVVVGIKKLPELTRSAGKAARILKSEAKAMKTDGPSEAPVDEGRVVRGVVVERDDRSPQS
ncbi:translocase [Streptomyces sp. NBRC 14336]|uniref:twin-arginine translocase TatA/TatE family subunit n=1 Tax=Streptomyces sp. NBRC 14336 TaxID=3030992 RepID=UPI0024A34710|nr:twin-arginine translocase TatA/TatE family subunit [Streptomyces sp. NBRC 14336]WBO75792.1 twin-arginine translocase TatA/TatE family subunit [Streptomyces sp. SBE_14.2]GLW49388.1 translocase [Streptomyces sp. NBRC 14336]